MTDSQRRTLFAADNGTRNRLPRVIAITGCSGLMGRQLIPVLQHTGTILRLLTRQPRADGPGITWVTGDLLNASSLRELVRGANEVVHLGGVAHTGLRSQTEREQAYAVNAGGTRSLLEAARESGVQRFLFMSSAHVYAGQHGLNINEDSPTADDSDYARIKLEAEAAVQEAVERGLSAVILRPCLTYGPGVRFNLKSLMQAVRRGYYIHPGASDVLRSFASVDTVTAAVVHLLGTRQFNGTYNVADHRPVVLRQWVDNLARLMQARRPRTLPLHVFRVLAAAGSTIAALGLPAPLTQASLRKLTTSFSLDVNKLAATGFVWPETNGDVLKKMVEAECTTG